MKNKILITGANGFIGANVVRTLLKSGNDILACDFNNTNIPENVTYLNIDILNEANNPKLYEILQKPDIIIHLAWQDGFNHYASSHINNLTKHFDFLKNMINSGCKSISVMGTAHEIGYHEGKIKDDTPCNPLSYYGISKNTLRQLLFVFAKDKDVSIKWLRAYYITGDDEHNHSVFTKLLQAAKEGKTEFPFTKGTNQFDFIDINDLAEMIAKASLQTEIDGIINVCSGEPTSMKDRVEDFIKEHNLNIKLNYGMFPSRKYDSPVIYGDNSKIEEILKNYRGDI